ncbi:MAG TPA: hypothetical protein VLA82_03940 [Actinomycetota bacterium]|nr:hypothetical protein [Actinomycetota bacterium]
MARVATEAGASLDARAGRLRDSARDDGGPGLMANDLERAWRQACALAPEHSLALPFVGEHVAVVGTGLAAGVARAYAALREDAAQGATDASDPDDLARRTYHRAVLLSHTGAEPALVETIEWLRSEAILAIAVGAPPGSPLDELAGVTVPLAATGGSERPDEAYALTSFAVLRHHLLGETGGRDAARAARAALPDASGVRRWVFVGRRWTLGLATTAARAFRRRGAAAFAGPPSALAAGDLGTLDPTTLVWWFDAADVDGAIADEDDDAPALRIAALDPGAELVLALRLADAHGSAGGT